MNDAQADPASALVDPQGRAASRRRAEDKTCPGCGAGSEKRVPSGGFGARHPVCGRCGHEWTEETWRE